MSNAFVYPETPYLLPERRLHVRQQVRALAYVELDEGNGGIILNVGEGGLCVQAVTRVMDDTLPDMRFQLPDTSDWIETNGRVIWSGESGKVAGVQYIDLPDGAVRQIKEWMQGGQPSAQAAAETTTQAEQEKEPEQLQTVPPASENTVSVAPSSEAVPTEDERAELSPPITETTAATMAALPVAQPAYVAPPPSSEAPALDQPRDFKFTLINDRQEAVRHEQEADSPWVLAGLLGFLALVSLAAGWAAGQGVLKNAVARLHWFASREQTADARGIQAPSSGSVARPSEIEIVNLSNQRWTIPFDGLPTFPGPGARGTADGTSLQAFRRAPAMAFNTWVLSPPVRSAGSATGGAAQIQTAPALPDEPAAEQSDGGSSIISSDLGAPRALAVPKAGPITGIVKQGELIHRVDPVYPGVAREQRIAGTVTMNIVIGEDGAVRSVEYVSGPRMLLDAAAEAVRKWRYAPTLLNDKPIESHRQVSLVFHL